MSFFSKIVENKAIVAAGAAAIAILGIGLYSIHHSGSTKTTTTMNRISKLLISSISRRNWMGSRRKSIYRTLLSTMSRGSSNSP